RGCAETPSGTRPGCADAAYRRKGKRPGARGKRRRSWFRRGRRRCGRGTRSPARSPGDITDLAALVPSRGISVQTLAAPGAAGGHMIDGGWSGSATIDSPNPSAPFCRPRLRVLLAAAFLPGFTNRSEEGGQGGVG